MEVAIAVTFSLLIIGGVYVTVFSIGRFSPHEEEAGE